MRDINEVFPGFSVCTFRVLCLVQGVEVEFEIERTLLPALKYT